MANTNYIGGIIKILETPQRQDFDNGTLAATVRAQSPTFRDTQLIQLTFWGNLANDALTYHNINDYLIIEGYLALQTKLSESNSPMSEKAEITVLKAYLYPSKSEI